MTAFLHTVPSLLETGGLSMAVLNQIEHGLIVCDHPGRVLFANQAAREELANGQFLRLDGAHLQRGTAASGSLELALRQAATRQRRALVRLSSGADQLLVSLVPLAARQDAPGEVLLMLGRRQLCSELGLELLAGSYGLTLAERRVLAALVRERTPREIAQEHAVALSTVRTQIAAIRAKLGARNVEALLLRAAQIPPVASVLRGAGRDPVCLTQAA
jgi:DNA-binding CsgD family transcriptional regulator